MPPPIRPGVTEEMIVRAFAINLKRCALPEARYIKYSYRELVGEDGQGVAGLECLDADLQPLMDGRSKPDLRTCFDPLIKCVEQQRNYDIREGRPAWSELAVILDLETGDLSRRTKRAE